MKEAEGWRGAVSGEQLKKTCALCSRGCVWAGSPPGLLLAAQHSDGMVSGKQGCSCFFQRGFGNLLAQLSGEFKSIPHCSLSTLPLRAEKES